MRLQFLTKGFAAGDYSLSPPRHPDFEALLEEPALLAAVEALLGGGAFDRIVYPRPAVLFTLPNSDTWTVPTGWHVDTPRLASGRRPGVQLFTFLDTVEPRGGGTLVVAGSHRLLNEGRFVRVIELRQLLCREAFFRTHRFVPEDVMKELAEGFGWVE